ncbi:MAG: Hsp33 family molecular chaperone HslO [Clostridiales bacterium]|nr:Hsp33 family molecular chaperone HslO [Clostridiales bacterium]
MKNLLRTLVFDGQISLTVADTTAIVQEGATRHNLSKPSAYVYGKAISAMTFMSACLKSDVGEISLSLKSDGECGSIGVSGNRNLYMRGYIENTQAVGDESACLGANGALTIVRDDGYNRPFVGSCAISEKGVDASFEEYYAVSEQLPTRIYTTVEFDLTGKVAFAGVAVLQALPFADESAQTGMQTARLDNLLAAVKEQGVERAVERVFGKSDEVWETREAVYQCNCSRERLLGVLVTLGERQVRQIIQEDGKINAHCHYCNTDYIFTEEDANGLFSGV